MIEMIRRIALCNFKSFDNITLDLTYSGNKGMNHAFIYGENGSGKTNLIDSLMFLGRSTMTPFREENHAAEEGAMKKLLEALGANDLNIKIKEEPRSISELAGEYRMIGSEGNMILKFDLDINGHEASYTLEFDEQNRLQTESLDYLISKNKGNLFRISCKEIRLQKDIISRNYRKEITELIGRYWGKHTFIGILMRESVAKNESFFSSEVSPNVRSFLEYIRSLVVIKKNQRFMPLCREMQLPSGIISSSDVQDLDRIESILSKFFSRLYSDIKSVHFTREGIGDERFRYELYFDKKIAGRMRSIPAEVESSGTKHLMVILPYLLMCADGKTVVIDEIDTGIHDLLVSQLIDQCIPDITGQLIATTHNTSLMTNKDAPNIFILSIDRNGFKRIASIQSTEPPNIKTNVQKRYLEGYYSGIPLTADIGLKDILESSKMKEQE